MNAGETMFPPRAPSFTCVPPRGSVGASLGQSPAPPADALCTVEVGVPDYRIGIGVDAHAFGEGVPLVLGGAMFDHPRGLVGHSDGDVIAHALTDALLGAAGLGDIGSLFPSGDETLRRRRLARAAGRRLRTSEGRRPRTGQRGLCSDWRGAAHRQLGATR